MVQLMRPRPRRPEIRRADSGQHPVWCDRARCVAGVYRLGEHRSEPITARVAPRSGHVVGTRVQTEDGSQWLDLTICVRLPDGPESGRARYAHEAMTALAVAVARAWYRRAAGERP